MHGNHLKNIYIVIWANRNSSLFPEHPISLRWGPVDFTHGHPCVACVTVGARGGREQYNKHH